jgi:hypothetical protein
LPHADQLAAKLEDVTRIMGKLASDLHTINLLPHRAYLQSPGDLPLTSAERDELLQQLKVYGRDPTNSDPIFTKEAGCTRRRTAFRS